MTGVIIAVKSPTKAVIQAHDNGRKFPLDVQELTGHDSMTDELIGATVIFNSASNIRSGNSVTSAKIVG